jgi:folate-binding protein YgfZ
MRNPYTRSPDRSVPATEYAAFEEGAALVDLSHKTILRLSGKDPIGMLNATLSNEVPSEERRGVYALLLNPKGRIQADLRVLRGGDGDVLIDTEPEGTTAAKALLGRYAPFSRVEVEDLSETDNPWAILGLYGPRAEELLGGLALAEHETAGLRLGGADLLAAGVTVPVPGYDLLGPAGVLRTAREHLAGRGAAPVGLHAYETARIKAGIPRFGSDITPENFPAEAGVLERAVSFEKGCYPGQETVARMRYRGHPNKFLYRFILEGGSPPHPGTPVFRDEKRVGEVTSLAPLPVHGEVFALGYLSRNANTQNALHAADATLRPLA